MVVTLGELAVRFGCELRGDPLREVDSVATLSEAHPRAVTFLAEGRHRAALAQFVLRGIDRSRCGALIYVSLAEHYIRIVPAEDAERVVSQEQWQTAVNEALRPLAAGETEAALTGLAARCGDLLAAHFPPGAPVDAAKQRFHIV